MPVVLWTFSTPSTYRCGKPTRSARWAGTSPAWGDYDAARNYCLQALTLRRRHDDPTGEVSTLGFIEHHIAHHCRAVHYCQQALTQLRALGNIISTADTLDRLGHPHAALGQHTQARKAWREALVLYQQSASNADAQRVQRQLDDPDSATDPSRTG